MSNASLSSDGDLWGLATYFNPVGYVNKYRHLELFSRSIRQQGLKLAVIELAFNDAPFVLNRALADMVIQVRSSSVMWQKERLLNIAIQRLPKSCDKVAWVDCDILFGNSSWVDETCQALEHFTVVQPYDLAWWFPPDITSAPKHLTADSFLFVKQGFVFTQTMEPRSGFPLGHSGFAWAARRGLLETHGFYDRLVLGGGDRAMACSMYSDSLVASSQALLEEHCSLALINNLREWKAKFYQEVRGNVGYISGPVFHLWHGARDNRKYRDRHKILKEADFDPVTDLAIDEQGCWKWNSEKPELHRMVREYFWCRQEDPFVVSPDNIAQSPKPPSRGS